MPGRKVWRPKQQWPEKKVNEKLTEIGKPKRIGGKKTFERRKRMQEECDGDMDREGEKEPDAF